MADKWIQLMSEDGADNLFPTSKMDLLWTNASPTSSFAEQTVQLDLSNYSTIVIMYAPYDSLQYYSSMICFKGTIYLVTTDMGSGGAASVARKATISNTGIAFETARLGYNGTATNNNTYIIPYKIYGIK